MLFEWEFILQIVVYITKLETEGSTSKFITQIMMNYG